MNSWWTRERGFELLLFLLAFGLRAWSVGEYEHLYPLADAPAIDEASYDAWARAIAAGDWIGKEVFFQEPLYPYSLAVLYALFGPELLVVRIAQALMWALTCVLVRRLTLRVFEARSSWIAGGLLAVYGPGLVFPALLLKENLFLPLLAGFALLLMRARKPGAWLLLGVLGALGALLRGNMLILLPLFALIAWWSGRWRSAAALSLGVALVLLPVGLRNWAVGGVFALSTSGAGTNLYGGNNAENPYGRASEFSFVRGIPEHEAEDWEHEAERRLGRELDRGEVSRYWMGQVLESVQRDPLLHLSILWNKLRLGLGHYEVPDNHCIDWDRQYLPLAGAPWPDFGVVGSLSLAGLLYWLMRGPRTRESVLLALLFALYLGTIVLTVTSDRARLPLVPLLLPFGGWWLAQGLQDWKPRLSCLLPALVLVWWPVLPAGERERDFREREYNFAVTRLRQDRLEEARAITDRLRTLLPDSARVRLLAMELDLRSGAGARGNLRTELEQLASDPRLLARERFHANVLAAQWALETGDSRAARAHGEAARVFDPEDPTLIELWITALAQGLELGLWDSAELQGAQPLLERCTPITRAGVEFLIGRNLRRADPRSVEGARRIESALDLLEAPSLDKSLPDAERARARKLAGKIQLALGRNAQALNHFRAALELVPGDPEAEAGLEAARAP